MMNGCQVVLTFGMIYDEWVSSGTMNGVKWVLTFGMICMNGCQVVPIHAKTMDATRFSNPKQWTPLSMTHPLSMIGLPGLPGHTDPLGLGNPKITKISK